jgi:hypothetical protein
MPRRLANPAAIRAHIDAVQGCEFEPFRACCGGHGETQIHHVLHGNANRKDAPWNLVSICKPAHDWAHRKTVDGMVLAWWVLHLRGAFDLEAIRQFWRRDPLARIEEVATDNSKPLRWQARKLLEVYGDA